MDPYVQIMRKHPRHTISPGRNIRFPYPYPLNRYTDWVSKHYSKGQHCTLKQTKPALQNPYPSFTLNAARSGWALGRFIHHPLSPNSLPSTNSLPISHAISLIRAGTMDKTLITNKNLGVMLKSLFPHRLLGWNDPYRNQKSGTLLACLARQTISNWSRNIPRITKTQSDRQLNEGNGQPM